MPRGKTVQILLSVGAKDMQHFLIMGDICTRACAFCDVATGKPKSLNPLEPIKNCFCS